jgi:CRP-like cAMP-binding protein
MANIRQGVDVLAHLRPTVFGRLGDKALDEADAMARVEHYELPSLLNSAGQQLQLLRLVVRGHIEIMARRASGKEIALSHVGPSGWATWLPCFVSAPPDYNFYSSADACFIALPVPQVTAFCQQHPEIYPMIIGEIGQRMRLFMEWTGQSVLVGPEQRMAKLIHILARDQRIAGNTGTLQATQTRLAAMARCTRQTANGLLNELERKGLISLAYGRFEVLDMAKLAAFAEEDQVED